MNLNSRIYARLLAYAGVLGALLGSIFQHSVTVMYPGGGSRFLGFFYGLLLFVVLPGILIRKSIRRLRLLTALYHAILLLLSVVCICTGLTFSYQLKTEEYLLYFLSVCATVLWYTGGVSFLLRFFAIDSRLHNWGRFRLIIYGAGGVLIGAFCNLLIHSVEELGLIHSWFLIIVLIIASLFIVRTEAVSTS